MPNPGPGFRWSGVLGFLEQAVFNFFYSPKTVPGIFSGKGNPGGTRLTPAVGLTCKWPFGHLNISIYEEDRQIKKKKVKDRGFK